MSEHEDDIMVRAEIFGIAEIGRRRLRLKGRSRFELKSIIRGFEAGADRLHADIANWKALHAEAELRLMEQRAETDKLRHMLHQSPAAASDNGSCHSPEVCAAAGVVQESSADERTLWKRDKDGTLTNLGPVQNNYSSDNGMLHTHNPQERPAQHARPAAQSLSHGAGDGAEGLPPSPQTIGAELAREFDSPDSGNAGRVQGQTGPAAPGGLVQQSTDELVDELKRCVSSDEYPPLTKLLNWAAEEIEQLRLDVSNANQRAFARGLPQRAEPNELRSIFATIQSLVAYQETSPETVGEVGRRVGKLCAHGLKILCQVGLPSTTEAPSIHDIRTCSTCDGRGWVATDESTANEYVQGTADCPDCGMPEKANPMEGEQ